MFDLIYPDEVAPEMPAPDASSAEMRLSGAGPLSKEYFPVIMPNGIVIGRAPREYCHSGAKPLHPVVHLHVLDRFGRLYLQKRSMKKDIQPGKWDTAVGGHVDYGESILEALYREASEELGFREYNPIWLCSYEFESEIEKEIYSSTARFDSLAIAISDAAEADDRPLYERLNKEINSLYVTEKREAIKRIMSNPKSFTNVILLYRRFSDNLALFADNMDFIYFKTAYDSLSPLYPNSAYVKSLKNDADNLQRLVELGNRLSEASELAYPELEMPDTESRMHKLSSLQGKPFILLFWSAANAEQKMYNLELKKIYDRYAGAGLNIYQVCVDSDKALWASVVKEQQLPWINVCDGRGASSQALATYALQRIPAMFIFDSEGNIVEKDQFDTAINIGASLVDECHNNGCNIISIGEMGIANTSPSSVWMSLFGQVPLKDCVGAGAGLNSQGIKHKYEILSEAIKNYKDNTTDEYDSTENIIRYFGGFEMVGTIGAMLRAAELRMIILIDGFIMTACALAVSKLYPETQDYMIFGHVGDEGGHRRLLNLMEAKPILDLGLRLGEGTGAICAFPIIDSAVRMINEMNNFDNAHITKYF